MVLYHVKRSISRSIVLSRPKIQRRTSCPSNSGGQGIEPYTMGSNNYGFPYYAETLLERTSTPTARCAPCFPPHFSPCTFAGFGLMVKHLNSSVFQSKKSRGEGRTRTSMTEVRDVLATIPRLTYFATSPFHAITFAGFA